MANDLGLYNPLFYAQEALIQLEAAMGLASRVFRGYDASPQQKGSQIQIRRPGTFTAANAPATATDLAPDQVTINLSNWKEVKFKLTDKEISHTKRVIIDEHIRPAAVAIANQIDTDLASLYTDVPWFVLAGGPAVVADINGVWKVLFDNKAPQDGMYNLMLDGTLHSEFMNLQAFSQFQGAGPAGAATQQTGLLGQKFGFDIFANQNTPSHTSTAAADLGGTVNGAHVKGATSLVVAALEASGVFFVGDTFVIAGNTQRYALTAETTMSGGAGTLSITPGLATALAGSEVITFDSSVASGSRVGVGFHRNAFALAMAPLSEIGNNVGANIATVEDPVTNLTLRSRLYYMPDVSEINVAIDVLYGFTTLDPNLACRLYDAV